MKTTIDIPEPLLDAVQSLARREGTTLKALTQEGLRKVLADRKAAKPFKLRDCTFTGDGLSPEFENASWEDIRDAIYEGRGG